MYMQALVVSQYNLHPTYLLSDVQFAVSIRPPNQLKVVVPASRFNLGFHSSAKRVSKSEFRFRNHGGTVHMKCEDSQVEHGDGFYIRRCVELARKAVGFTSPNPMVGCVIVKDGKIVGEGFHPKAGQPHAEVFALRDAGDLAENATAYVSLEPCNHFGRTPPCSEALIKAKVKKVVVGTVDPNPIVASKGVHRLRDAGIEVTVGVEEELCKKLIEAFAHQMLTGKPFVTLRYSISIDGHLVDQLGSKSMEAGGYYSQLLQEYDAVILSSSLLTAKSFIPTSKEPGANQPLRIAIAKFPNSRVQIPVLTNESNPKMIIFTETEIAEANKEGIEAVVSERITLTDILEHCKRQGLCSVLLDLRGNLADLEEILREGFEENMLRKVVVEVLPISMGSEGEALKILPSKLSVKSLTSRVSGESTLLEGYFDKIDCSSG